MTFAETRAWAGSAVSLSRTSLVRALGGSCALVLMGLLTLTVADAMGG